MRCRPSFLSGTGTAGELRALHVSFTVRKSKQSFVIRLHVADRERRGVRQNASGHEIGEGKRFPYRRPAAAVRVPATAKIRQLRTILSDGTSDESRWTNN